MASVLISGFTFVKDGLSLGYPVRESIASIEALCDEVIVNVGLNDPDSPKDDGTYEYLRDHFPGKKFRFLTSHWDRTLTTGGLILSQQTNRALDACRGRYAQYIQADEVLHEEDLLGIHSSVMEMERRREIDGLLFTYCHFYGNANVEWRAREAYRREVRLVRNFSGISSWKDAQGFRRKGKKIKAKDTGATVYHYGWARKEKTMVAKKQALEKLYHGSGYRIGEFSYGRRWALRPFRGKHPQVMDQWIRDKGSDLDIMGLPLRWQWGDIKLVLSEVVEKITGHRLFEYKNFVEIQ